MHHPSYSLSRTFTLCSMMVGWTKLNADIKMVLVHVSKSHKQYEQEDKSFSEMKEFCSRYHMVHSDRSLCQAMDPTPVVWPMYFWIIMFASKQQKNKTWKKKICVGGASAVALCSELWRIVTAARPFARDTLNVVFIRVFSRMYTTMEGKKLPHRYAKPCGHSRTVRQNKT